MESERSHPGSHQYHKYMHIVQTTDSYNGIKELEWEGITGRVKRLLVLQDARVEKLLDHKLELLDSKLEMLLDRVK